MQVLLGNVEYLSLVHTGCIRTVEPLHVLYRFQLHVNRRNRSTKQDSYLLTSIPSIHADMPFTITPLFITFLSKQMISDSLAAKKVLPGTLKSNHADRWSSIEYFRKKSMENLMKYEKDFVWGRILDERSIDSWWAVCNITHSCLEL